MEGRVLKKSGNLKWFTLGVVVCLLVTTLIVPAFASTLSKTAQIVYDNIKITLNGNTVTPKDANGNTVEPFTINGTTYLPVRAAANALGIGVTWDEVTKTVKLTNGQTSQSEKAKITEIRNWLVGDIWNAGFCDMEWFFTTGKSSTGETMDPEFSLQQLTKAMEKKPGYDAYMSTLSANHAELSELWTKVSKQIDVLYADIKSRNFAVGGQELDTGLFNQYSDAFDKAYYNLP